MMCRCLRDVVAFLGLREMGLNSRVNPLWVEVCSSSGKGHASISGIFGLSGFSGQFEQWFDARDTANQRYAEHVPQ